MELAFPIIAILISFVSAFWAIWAALKTKRSEKVNKTTELFILFNNTEFLNTRGIGWEFLKEINENESSATIGTLWEDYEDKARIDKFNHLYSVLAFWQMLYILGQQNEINKTLANKFFHYEYALWHKHSSMLIKNTIFSEEDLPSYVEVFKENPEWLSNKR